MLSCPHHGEIFDACIEEQHEAQIVLEEHSTTIAASVSLQEGTYLHSKIMRLANLVCSSGERHEEQAREEENNHWSEGVTNSTAWRTTRHQ